MKIVRWLRAWILVRPGFAGLVAALSLVGFGGVIGNLLDVDHILVLLVRGDPITLPNILQGAGRPLHTPSVIVSGCVFLIGHALGGRLLAGDREKTRKLYKVR